MGFLGNLTCRDTRAVFSKLERRQVWWDEVTSSHNPVPAKRGPFTPVCEGLTPRVGVTVKS